MILPGLCLYMDLWITVVLLLIKITTLYVIHKLDKCVLRFTVAEFCFPFCPFKLKTVYLLLLVFSVSMSKNISPE